MGNFVTFHNATFSSFANYVISAEHAQHAQHMWYSAILTMYSRLVKRYWGGTMEGLCKRLIDLVEFLQADKVF